MMHDQHVTALAAKSCRKKLIEGRRLTIEADQLLRAHQLNARSQRDEYPHTCAHPHAEYTERRHVKGPNTEGACRLCVLGQTRRPPYVCECKTHLTAVNSVPGLYQPGMGDPHKDIFPTTVVVGVTIYIFSRRSSVVVTLGVLSISRL